MDIFPRATDDDGTDEPTRIVQPPPSWAVRLQTERRARGWSEYEMARRLLQVSGSQHGSFQDLTRQVLAWETGEPVPRGWATAYATVFGMDEAELFESVYTPLTFGQKMCALLAERGISQRKLATMIHYDGGHLSKISRDLKPPSPQLAECMDTALGADGELAALAPPRTTTQQPDAEVQPLQPDLLTATVGGTGTVDDRDDMERRLLLQLAALGLGAGTLGSTGEPLRQLLGLVVTSELRSIDDWEITCADHMHALSTRSPVQVRDALIVDLVAVQRQSKTASSHDTPELHRVLALLSMIHANALTRLGDHGTAIHWWRTARAAADQSGDLALRLVIRGEEAGVGLYGQRDPATVLRLLDNAHQLAGDSPAPWLAADFANTRAKTLTVLGRHEEAIRELNTFVDLASTGAPRSLIPGHSGTVSPSRVHFAESWVYAGAGDEAQADQARDRVLVGGFGGYQYAANVRLHEALCTVVNGGIDQGARQAATVLDTLPPPHRSHMITETGNIVLRAVPLDQHQRPAVREFREVLVGTAPTRAF